MPMTRKQYVEVRLLMKPGDVIAFGGKGLNSAGIEKVTDSFVSHVGVIVQAETASTGPILVDATKEDGVDEKSFNQYVVSYDGDVWWLPIKQILQGNNLATFQSFCKDKLGTKFDATQAPWCVIYSRGSALEKIERNMSAEDLSKLFCSEFVAAALRTAEVLPGLNVSKVSPADLCRFAIFTGEYAQLKEAETKEISGYNTTSPEGGGARRQREKQ